MTIKAAFFDLDGTLIDSEMLWIDSYMEVLSSLGLELNREIAIHRVHGRSFKELYATTCLDRHDFCLSLEEMEKRMRKSFVQFRQKKNIVIDSSVKKLIELAEHCFIAIVSGSPRQDIFSALKLMKVEQYVEYVVGAEDYRKGKPDPEGYLKAMAYKNLQPQECLVFEDSKAGIRAAKAAGMQCIALTVCNHFNADLSEADKIVSDLSEINLDELTVEMIL